jgi:hypothetical protein
VAHLPHEARRPPVHGQRLLAKGAGIDRWEDGFDRWTPRAEAAAADDTAVELDLDRESLLRLARELAEQRHSEREHARAELEQLKQALRDRAESVAARERELADLQRRADAGGNAKPGRQGSKGAGSGDALVARERAALDRAKALDARERALEERQAALAAEAARIADREAELEAELARARDDRGRSESELQLAAAERERLDEREQEARRIEKELAARRIALEAAAARRAAGDRHDPSPASGEDDPHAERERELHALEAKLEARERELALVRQGLDAERNTLLERDRELRRREVADLRQSFDAPFTPPSFSEGLAAFTRARSRD